MNTVAKLVRRRTRLKREKIPHDWPLPDTLMGIELEVERAGSTYSDTPPAEWTVHRDGSLNNGVEFVLAQPLAGADLRTAIRSIFVGNSFSRSMTGSTHIHMDMLEENSTTEVLQVMVLLVYCLESMLFAAGDPAREWCGYANRLQSGPDNLMSVVMSDSLHEMSDTIIDQFSRNYSRNSSQFGRYYGLNLASLLDYGSLEFRYFPTATSEQEMVEWVELVQQFKKAAIFLGNVEALMEVMATEENYLAFLHSQFGKYAALFSYLGSYPEVRSSFHKALLTAKISTEKPAPYDGKKIFGSGKFSKFVKNLPEDLGKLLVMGRDIFSIPSSSEVGVNTVMVYNNSVYVMWASRPGSGPQWQMVTDVPGSYYHEATDLLDTLSILRGDDEVWVSVNRYHKLLITEMLNSVSSSVPADLPSFDDDDFDDDYEEDNQ